MIRIEIDILAERAEQLKTLFVCGRGFVNYVSMIPLFCKYGDNINILFGYLFV